MYQQVCASAAETCKGHFRPDEGGLKGRGPVIAFRGIAWAGRLAMPISNTEVLLASRVNFSIRLRLPALKLLLCSAELLPFCAGWLA